MHFLLVCVAFNSYLPRFGKRGRTGNNYEVPCDLMRIGFTFQACIHTFILGREQECFGWIELHGKTLPVLRIITL